MANRTGMDIFESGHLSQPVLLGDNTDVQPEDQTTRMTEIVNKQDTGAQASQWNVPNQSCAQSFDLRSLSKANAMNKHTCDVCSTTFKKHRQLQLHKLKHIGVKLFKCDDCGAAFSRLTNLRAHRRIHTGERPFKCDICDADFRKNIHLKNHKMRHTGLTRMTEIVDKQDVPQSIDLRSLSKANVVNKLHKCDVCSAAFKNSRKLQLHKLKHTGEKLFKCDDCGAAYSRFSNLRDHRRIHTGERPFICDVCDATFRKNAHLKNHKIKLHTGLTRITKIVDKQDVQKNDIIDSRTTMNAGVLPGGQTTRMTETMDKKDVQMNNVNVARTNVDDGLAAIFVWLENKDTSVMQNENTVTNHKSDGTLPAGEITAECCQVDAVSGAVSDVQNTELKVVEENPWKSDVCTTHSIHCCGQEKYKSMSVKKEPFVNYSSDSECDHAEHQAMDTGAQASQCDVPNQSCAQSIDLRSLSKANVVNKPHKCDVCSAAFKKNRKLQLHKLKHAGVKLFKCDDCGAAFSRLGNLKDHRRIHTGERPFKCDVCDADFRKNVHLKNHKIKVHTGERPYKCDVCGECYAQSETLKIHTRTHTGEKPYKCDDCDAAFPQLSQLRLHKTMHTGEKPCKCDVCGATFMQRRKLWSHKKKRHAREKS